MSQETETKTSGDSQSVEMPFKFSTMLLLIAGGLAVLLPMAIPSSWGLLHILAGLAFVVIVYLIIRNGLVSLIVVAPLPMLSYYAGVFTLRPMHLVLLFTYVAWFLRHSLYPRRIRVSSLLLPLVLWLLVSLASSINALNKLVVFRGSTSIALLIAIFLYILNHIRSMRDMFLALKMLLLTSVLVMGYGLYQFLGFYLGWGDPIRAILMRLPLNPYYLDIIEKQRGINRATINFINVFPRPTSFLGDPNFLSGYVISLLPVAICLFMFAMARKRVIATVVLGIYIILAFFLAIATFSRSGLVALLVALLITLMLVRTERHYFRLLVPLTVAVVGCIVVLMLVLPDLMPLEAYIGRFVALANFLQSNPLGGDTYRMQTMMAGMEFFQRHPVLGVGTGNFGEYYRALIGGSILGRGQFTLITILAENGLLGLAVLSWIVLIVLWKTRWVLRLRHRDQHGLSHLLIKGLFAGFCGLVVSNLLYEYYTLEFVWVYAAIFVASSDIIRQDVRIGELRARQTCV